MITVNRVDIDGLFSSVGNVFFQYGPTAAANALYVISGYSFKIASMEKSPKPVIKPEPW